MTKGKEFYNWYNEEIEPLITQIKEKMAKRNKNMEYVFVMSEPKPDNSLEVPTITDYHCLASSLPCFLVDVIESQLDLHDTPDTLN